MAKEQTKKTETVEAPAQATAQATAPAQPDPMALSIGDLKGLASIIDVASTRGAFKAAELAGVGTLYNKLSTFLATVEAKSAQQAATDKATQASAPAEGK
jgi:hypothetical protein|tara:strand:- start:3172 stop:3471 length:300 start_codon:yes stop_codon:yes gene_type:complete